jgi:hypothetical protein
VLYAGLRRHDEDRMPSLRHCTVHAARIASGNGTDAPVAGSIQTITTLPSA